MRFATDRFASSINCKWAHHIPTSATTMACSVVRGVVGYLFDRLLGFLVSIHLARHWLATLLVQLKLQLRS